MDTKSKEFKALKAKWYKKLKDTGFEDIEQDETYLKVWSSYFFKVNYNATLFEAKEDYYRMAGYFLNEHKFESEYDRLVWSMHADGLGIREIAKRLRRKKMKAYVTLVHSVVRRLSKVMVTLHVSSK